MIRAIRKGTWLSQARVMPGAMFSLHRSLHFTMFQFQDADDILSAMNAWISGWMHSGKVHRNRLE